MKLIDGIYNDGNYKYIATADEKKRKIKSILLLLEKNEKREAKTFTTLDNFSETYPIRDENDDYSYSCNLKIIPEEVEKVPLYIKATEDKVPEKIEELQA